MYINIILLIIILIHEEIHDIRSECSNACSGHGKCGMYDACKCYRNYYGNDCSLRICQFGLAHIDTPLGDLNSDLEISEVSKTVVYGSDLYPKGTQEVYPNMIDSNGNILTNTAHKYRECSNKGVCNRVEGICNCIEGYTGSACQYMQCPGSDSITTCSGHGTCETIANIAKNDNNNIYKLWDEDITRGCVCDSGYYGYDCSFRYCKQGFDPLYIDNIDQSFRYSNWSYIIYHKNENATIFGNYSLFFYDIQGQRWETDVIDYNTTCKDIIYKLEHLPNNVIPVGSVRCLKWNNFHKINIADEPFLANSNGINPFYGIKYTLTFPRNPGLLKELDINIHTEYGTKVATLYTNEPKLSINPTQSTLGWFIYPNGFTGEFDDYIHDRCENVDVTISTQIGPGDIKYQYLSGLTTYETRLLKRCLGDADGISTKFDQQINIQGQSINFDYGTVINPHIIKMVDKTDPPYTDICGSDNNEGLRGSLKTKLCKYGFATSQESTDTPENNPINNQLNILKTIPNNFKPEDTPYFGPDRNHRAPSFYVPLIFDPITQRFKLFTKPGEDYSTTTTFSIFTTKGTLISASHNIRLFSSVNTVSKNVRLQRLGEGLYSNILYTTNSTSIINKYNGDISCENTPTGSFGVINCIEKNNLVFIFDPTFSTTAYNTNPKYLNIYRIDRVSSIKQLPVYKPLYGEPTFSPTIIPTIRPSAKPTITPTLTPTKEPTVSPTLTPTKEPTVAPTTTSQLIPSTPSPTVIPTLSPTKTPTKTPTIAPTDGTTTITTPQNFYYTQIQLNMGMNAYYLNSPSSNSKIYTFYPHIDSTYNYVSECSSRGECDWSTEVGDCICHKGYKLDDCSYQVNPST